MIVKTSSWTLIIAAPQCQHSLSLVCVWPPPNLTYLVLVTDTAVNRAVRHQICIVWRGSSIQQCCQIISTYLVYLSSQLPVAEEAAWQSKVQMTRTRLGVEVAMGVEVVSFQLLGTSGGRILASLSTHYSALGFVCHLLHFSPSYLRYKVAHKLRLSLQPPATAGTTISLSQVTLLGCWLHSLAGGKVDKMVTLSRLFSSQFIFSYSRAVGGRGCRRVDISSDHASAIRGSLLLVHFICILKRENILVGK